jgi:hypothetical protein
MKMKKEENNIQSEELVDLPVTTEQARLTNGGRTCNEHGTHVAGTVGAVGNNLVG